VILFGVFTNSSLTICGTSNVLDDQWHHIAAQHGLDGRMSLYVDGRLEADYNNGPTGDLSYPDDGTTNYCGGVCSNNPYLVIGAEKHDIGLHYSGWLTEVRLSTTQRYSTNFTRPTQPFVADANTAALYHFDESSGDNIYDTSGALGGPSNGVRRYGGTPAGPEWSTETPFAAGPPPVPTITLSANPTSVNSGASSSLSWSSTNAGACTASGAWSGTRNISGSESTGSLSATSSYTLTCTGSGGSTYRTVTVTVNAPPPPPSSTPAAGGDNGGGGGGCTLQRQASFDPLFLLLLAAALLRLGRRNSAHGTRIIDEICSSLRESGMTKLSMFRERPVRMGLSLLPGITITRAALSLRLPIMQAGILKSKEHTPV
jgi:hypothetical protein